jgi:DNA-directed RNA polymerase subunit H (RpoH/RPB5)
METRALEQLKTILERQGFAVPSIERQPTPKTVLDRVNIYTMGGFMVFFSQKDKIAESDLYKYREHSNNAGGPNRTIVVAMSKPSENVEKVIKHLIANADHMRFFHVRELQIDITQHRLWMPHFLYNDKFKKARPDIAEMFERYRIEKVEEALGRMDCMDIGARLAGAFPGDVVYIQRHSDTGGYTPYWRRVVEDANVDQ